MFSPNVLRLSLPSIYLLLFPLPLLAHLQNKGKKDKADKAALKAAWAKGGEGKKAKEKKVRALRVAKSLPNQSSLTRLFAEGQG